MGIGELLGLASMQVIQSLRHAFPGQRMHIHGLCVLEKVVDIGRRDRVLAELFFQPPETERREH
jgi:hypothetical protein